MLCFLRVYLGRAEIQVWIQLYRHQVFQRYKPQPNKQILIWIATVCVNFIGAYTDQSNNNLSINHYQPNKSLMKQTTSPHVGFLNFVTLKYFPRKWDWIPSSPSMMQNNISKIQILILDHNNRAKLTAMKKNKIFSFKWTSWLKTRLLIVESCT